MGFIRSAIVFGAGYVFGARAGRERYEQIKTNAQKLWNSEPVAKGRGKAKSGAKDAFSQAQDAASEKFAQAQGVASEKFHEASATVKTKVAEATDSATRRGESDPDEIHVEAVRYEG